MLVHQQRINDHLDQFFQGQQCQLQQHRRIIEAHLKDHRFCLEELVRNALNDHIGVSRKGSKNIGLNEMLFMLSSATEAEKNKVGLDAVQRPVGVDGFEEENGQTGLHDDAASIKLDDVETPYFDEATANGGVILLGHAESESECGQLWETRGRQSVDSEICISGTNLLDAIFDQEVSLGSPIHWPKRFDLDDVSINVRANSTADMVAKEAQMYDSGPIMLGHIADGEKENPTPSHLDEDLQHKLAVQFSQEPWRGSLASSSGTHTGRSSQQSLSETFGPVDRDKSYRIRRTSQVEAAFRMNKAYHLETKRIRQEASVQVGRSGSLVECVREGWFSWNFISDHYVKSRLLQLDWLETFVDSKYFRIAICVLVVANACFVGVTTDMSMRTALDAHSKSENEDKDILSTDAVFYINIMFNIFFFIELVMRMVSQEGRFCFGPECFWNFFDMFVVVMSIIEVFLLVAGFSSNYIRVLRLAKVVRSVRMLRLARFLTIFNKLHAVSLAFARCRSMLVCAMLCLCLVVFVFAVFFTNAVADYVSDASSSDPHVADMHLFFGSLFMAMLTLFMAISGGLDWWSICQLLLPVGVVYVVVFLLFIAIMVLAVLNVINAIFVNDAVDATQHDLDLRSQAEMSENKVMLRRLIHIFQDMEKDRRDQVNLDAFVRYMESPEMRMQLSLLGLHFCDGVALFRFLDVDRTSSLTIDQFVMGCLRLKGEAILIDMDVEIKQARDMLMDIQHTLLAMLAERRNTAVSKDGEDCMALSKLSSVRSLPQRFDF